MSAIDSPPAVRTLRIALIGNPNTGKSTLFNALAGMHSHVGNYPGVTVEKKIGHVRWPGRTVELIDLPGTYSLAPRSLDEMVAVNVLLGRQAEIGTPDAVVCIVDASNLERNLYLVSQVLDVGLPTVLVLNMWDVAQSRGIRMDPQALEARLGVPVVVTSAHRRAGIGEVQSALERALAQGPATRPQLFPPEFVRECQALGEKLTTLGYPDTPYYLLERLLLDVGGYIESHLAAGQSEALAGHLREARARLAAAGCRVPGVEARVRYRWAGDMLREIVTRPVDRPVTLSDRIDAWLTHWFWGMAIFACLMLLIFQAIYTWAAPLMELFETGQGLIGKYVATFMGPGPLRSLLLDGVVAGVGGVLVFLPQIVFLFLFIALLEDCGYMARAAFLMDKLMTKVGLSGKSFVPLMSSFACAIPGVMAARTIENRRDRMVTILVAPLMSCSARVPVYVLLIGAFLPVTSYKGLVLFGFSALGALFAIPVAWTLKKTLFRGETPPFVMELPSYKWPSPWIVLHRVYDRSKAFVMRAGTLIFTMSVLIWAAGYFPGDHREADRVQAQIEQLEASANPETVTAEQEALAERLNQINGALLDQSLLGRLGHIIEPVVRPLGWDWKIGVGVIASFPAREVIISTLGTIYSLGSDVDEKDAGLQEALRQSKWPDGRPVYNIPVALSIMVFFALCAECASTLMVIWRETNSWVWPLFTFTYMTLLAYVGAFLTYQIGMWFV